VVLLEIIMVLNHIWIAFFVIAFVIAVCKIVFTGDLGVFNEMMDAVSPRRSVGGYYRSDSGNFCLLFVFRINY